MNDFVILSDILGLKIMISEFDWQTFKQEYGIAYQPYDATTEEADRSWFRWHKFRGDHFANTCLLNEQGEVIGLIIKDTVVRNLSLPSLPALQYLCICDNEKLEKLDFTGDYPELQHLELTRNGLTQLILKFDLRSLKMLDIRKNKLMILELPHYLPALEVIDASYNVLRKCTLPGELPELKYVCLSDNGMEMFSTKSYFSRLRVLDLRNNHLAILPPGNYDVLETLYVKGNPLKSYEETLIEGDESGNASEIIAQLRNIARSGSLPNYRAKLVIVGNGRVGKTCLIKRLKGQACEGNEAYTHGVAISELDKSHFPGVNTDKLFLKVWDFGGQEVFYATHQLFMSEEALYLYAWTDEAIARQNQKNDTNTSPRHERWRAHPYWIESVRMHSKKSQLLLVKTHHNKSKDNIPAEVKSSYPEGVDYQYLNFEAKSPDEYLLNELRNKITHELNKILDGQEYPKNYYDLIEEISLYRQKGNDELSLYQFNLLAEKYNISDSFDVLKYLHKTGEVIYLDKFPDNIYINPYSLTKRIYRLIEGNDILEESDGEFSEKFAEETLQAADWKNLLELMIEFELVFRKPGVNSTDYIAPQYLPNLLDKKIKDKQRTPFLAHKTDRKLRFTLRYPDILPENVIVNLISKYGPYTLGAVYRDAIFFMKNITTESGNNAAEGCYVETNEEKREIEVYTHINQAGDTLARLVFEDLMKLSKKAKVHLSTDSDRWINAKNILEQKGEKTYGTVDGDGSTVEVSKFAFLKKNAGFMEVKKLDKIFISYSHHDNKTHDDWIENFVKKLRDVYKSSFGKDLNVFFDQKDIATGNVLSKKIDEELSNTLLFIPIITPAYLSSKWCRQEFMNFMQLAGEELIVGSLSRILPIRLMPWDDYKTEQDTNIEANEIMKFIENNEVIYRDFYEGPLPVDPQQSKFKSEIALLSKEIWQILRKLNVHDS